MNHYNLHPQVQKWIFKQGWSDLREIQKRAIQPILAGDCDVLISASTAAGKTEAFFLPACSAIADTTGGFGILYISPLKALINDQYRRLEGLCEMLDMQLTPWHGDSAQSKKKAARKSPSGILLITPESLESLLVRDSGWVRQAFGSLQYIVIDEFHAFIGTERGQHLLSLLNRLEHLIGRHGNPVPRVALSATLGDLESVPASLRPDKTMQCATIFSARSEAVVKVVVKGYLDPVVLDSPKPGENIPNNAEDEICQELYRICRDGSHLIFANSRKRTESLAAKLSDLCESQVVPNEFFPHHGSLAKEARESLEARLQKETLPTTVVCTMTLELGIDIGKVNSVVQVTAPHSVSSLRQRLGRSGRRGGPAILRMLIAEDELHANSSLIDKLRMELLQSLAMTRLLIAGKWFEPADAEQFHFSTLLHQVLAVTAQWGGVRADQLYRTLCQTGPFQQVTVDHFKQLLTHMGQEELLTQLSSGELVLGLQGEKLVSHYTFYAVFKTPEEFRVVAGPKTLGTLPVDTMILVNQHIIFGGKRWKVIDIDADKKVIAVERAKGGQPPKFGGAGMGIHDVVRQEMLSIYRDGDYRISVGANKVDFLDDTARNLFAEGQGLFNQLNLGSESVLQQGENVCVFPWLGDKVVNTLVAMLTRMGYQASAFAGVIEIEKADAKKVGDSLFSLLDDEPPLAVEL
ncbi:DEAD/DEAH box helicase [Oceanobacter mangrovi]|uniref:DEAD/DEAH box helicase n=1 Tax=Oceanobacter mangrovi TaxID=2862510 RepID=UPI001C8E5A3B|nr:DEAD/DEAH box helicase [Oceanobacter mangrovi]